MHKGENITLRQLQDVSFMAGPNAAALLHTKAQTAETFRDSFLFPIMSTLNYFSTNFLSYKEKWYSFFYIIGLRVCACVSTCPVIEPMSSFDETSLERTPLESNPKPPFSLF
jgi:hypothetical protein